MITRSSKFGTGVAVLAAGAAATLALGQGVANAGTTGGSVDPGILTTSAGNTNLTRATFGFDAVTDITGSVTLTASDARGGGAASKGWVASLEATPFLYVGDHASGQSRASLFAFASTSNAAAEWTQGTGPGLEPREPGSHVGNQGLLFAVDADPWSPTYGQSLPTPRSTMSAVPGEGNGTYTQVVGLSLLVPAETPVGRYTSTVTTTIVTILA